MNTTNWTASILLISMLFGNAAFGQNQERQCRNIVSGDVEHDRLKDLFRYANVAERPKHRNSQFMEDCPQTGDVIVEAPRNISPLYLTEEIEDDIRSEMEEMRIDGAYLERADDGSDSLSIGCTEADGNTSSPIKIRINTYYALVRDFFSLEFSFSEEVANKDEYGNITRSIGSPYLNEGTGEIIYSMRGTELRDVDQIRTNYIGNVCAFPAVEVVVSHVCHVFREELENHFKDNRFGIEHSRLVNIKSSLEEENIKASYSTTLTGHSLGGQAVQYVAENPPQACLRDSKNAHDSLRAYAFASTRNPSKNPAQDGDLNGMGNQSIVQSYLIFGDQVLNRLELGQEQTGRVTTYRPDAGSLFDSRHSIEEIQDSICDCLERRGNVSIREGSNS